MAKNAKIIAKTAIRLVRNRTTFEGVAPKAIGLFFIF